MPKGADRNTAADKPLVRKTSLLVSNECGLHIRAAAMLVRLAEAIDARLTIACGRQRVNGKSIMSLLTLGAAKGMFVHAVAEGPEAHQMIQAIKELFAEGFYEKAESQFKISPQPGPPNHGSAHTMENGVIHGILDRVGIAPPGTAPARPR